MLAAVMFSAAFPLFVTVTVCAELLPTATLLKASEDGLIEICADVAVPVPVRPIFIGDPGALLLIDTVPVALPAVVGVNVAVKDAVCPGFNVCDATVLIVNPVPLTEPLLIDTAAVPVFVSVTGIALLPPTSTLPKPTAAGLAVSAPCVPAPVRPIVDAVLEALLVIEMLPVALAVDVGANVTVNEELAPALMVTGAAKFIV